MSSDAELEKTINAIKGGTATQQQVESLINTVAQKFIDKKSIVTAAKVDFFSKDPPAPSSEVIDQFIGIIDKIEKSANMADKITNVESALRFLAGSPYFLGKAGLPAPVQSVITNSNEFSTLITNAKAAYKNTTPSTPNNGGGNKSQQQPQPKTPQYGGEIDGALAQIQKYDKHNTVAKAIDAFINTYGGTYQGLTPKSSPAEKLDFFIAKGPTAGGYAPGYNELAKALAPMHKGMLQAAQAMGQNSVEDAYNYIAQNHYKFFGSHKYMMTNATTALSRAQVHELLQAMPCPVPDPKQPWTLFVSAYQGYYTAADTLMKIKPAVVKKDATTGATNDPTSGATNTDTTETSSNPTSLAAQLTALGEPKADADSLKLAKDMLGGALPKVMEGMAKAVGGGGALPGNLGMFASVLIETQFVDFKGNVDSPEFQQALNQVLKAVASHPSVKLNYSGTYTPEFGNELLAKLDSMKPEDRDAMLAKIMPAEFDTKEKREGTIVGFVHMLNTLHKNNFIKPDVQTPGFMKLGEIGYMLLGIIASFSPGLAKGIAGVLGKLVPGLEIDMKLVEAQGNEYTKNPDSFRTKLNGKLNEAYEKLKKDNPNLTKEEFNSKLNETFMGLVDEALNADAALTTEQKEEARKKAREAISKIAADGQIDQNELSEVTDCLPGQQNSSTDNVDPSTVTRDTTSTQNTTGNTGGGNSQRTTPRDSNQTFNFQDDWRTKSRAIDEATRDRQIDTRPVARIENGRILVSYAYLDENDGYKKKYYQTDITEEFMSGRAGPNMDRITLYYKGRNNTIYDSTDYMLNLRDEKSNLIASRSSNNTVSDNNRNSKRSFWDTFDTRVEIMPPNSQNQGVRGLFNLLGGGGKRREEREERPVVNTTPVQQTPVQDKKDVPNSPKTDGSCSETPMTEEEAERLRQEQAQQNQASPVVAQFDVNRGDITNRIFVTDQNPQLNPNTQKSTAGMTVSA